MEDVARGVVSLGQSVPSPYKPGQILWPTLVLVAGDAKFQIKIVLEFPGHGEINLLSFFVSFGRILDRKRKCGTGWLPTALREKGNCQGLPVRPPFHYRGYLIVLGASPPFLFLDVHFGNAERMVQPLPEV